MRIGIDFEAGQTGLYLGLYEVELNRHLRRLCRPGDRAYDVGGQFGYDALVIAKLTGAEVVSLECDPVYVDVIRRNASLNPGCRVEAREAFVADRTGGSMLALDDLARSTFVPDFIKIDIEGGEVAALQGAAHILAERRPGLVIEVHSVPLEEECRRILEAHGYQIETVTPRRWLPDYRPIEHNRWLVAA